jgi:putative flavoprotein involved in K+ transport
MTENTSHYPVVIVGAGQAGLSMSWYLKRAGIAHLVLERYEPGYTWKHERWDSFCLVTPNWQCQLPGYPYAGDDPHGFMLRDEIVAYLEGFRRSFDPPVRSGVTVTQLDARPIGGFALVTDAGDKLTADQVVVATGGYHDPILPPYAAALDADILQMNAAEYRAPEALPTGAVLVVGTGQSGAQLAEDLHLAGRVVHLCVGEAPRVARSYRGKDVVEWLHLMGYYDIPVDQHPLREGVRDKTNHYVTGRDGGHEIDLRKFALEGMHLYGSLAGIRDGKLSFKPNLQKNLDEADNVSESIKRSIDAFIAKQNIVAPVEPPYQPAWQPGAPVGEIDYRAANISSVLWCIGFRTNFRWISVPVFDGHGRPVHERGVSRQPGLYFLGLPWLHSWGSARMSGVSRDAAYLAERIDQALSHKEAA